jgi:hypothetical protein
MLQMNTRSAARHAQDAVTEAGLEMHCKLFGASMP